MTPTPKEMFFRAVTALLICTAVCRGSESSKSYGPPTSNNDRPNSYEPEFQRPLAVFTEKPVKVADFVLIPVIQVPSTDLRMIYRPQIDSVSKTEPIIMCKSLSKSFEATPAVQVPLQQPLYLYDERTLIPFPKTVTILHGGYRVSIPVGLVVAPVPVGILKTGPVFVTTLYAIPAGPMPAPLPIPVRFSPPWTYYPQNPVATQYSAPPPPPPPPSYTQPVAPSQYSPPVPPPKYSPPAPPAPLAYYQQNTDYSSGSEDGGDLPGKLYTQFAANPAPPAPFHNSKESPLLLQLREESEKNRNKYGSQRPPPPPQYPSHQYQTIDA